eukprot:12001317-Heterocapsa_arctica.AAC.1
MDDRPVRPVGPLPHGSGALAVLGRGLRQRSRRSSFGRSRPTACGPRRRRAALLLTLVRPLLGRLVQQALVLHHRGRSRRRGTSARSPHRLQNSPADHVHHLRG